MDDKRKRRRSLFFGFVLGLSCSVFLFVLVGAGANLFAVRDTGEVELKEIAAGLTPDADHVHVYAKADGKVYSKDDAGTEYDLTAGSAHNLLSATHGDTTGTAVARGSIVTGQGVAPKWTRLTIGVAGTFLRSDGTDAAWTAIADADVPDTITLTNITQITNRSHTSLTDIGTNTHAQIDTHVADGAVHFTQASITTVGTIGTGVWQGTAVDATHGGTAQTTWTLGDMLYSSAANTLAKLAGNTTTTTKYLTQTGDGAVSAAPAWAVINDATTAVKGVASFNSTDFAVAAGAVSLQRSRNFILTAGGGWPSTTAGCAANTKVEYATNKVNLYLLDFDAATAEYAEWTAVMPADYNGGTITAIFYWLANDATTNAVVWGLQGRCYADADAIDQAMGTAQTVTDANASTANQVRISAATAAITLAGAPAANQLVQFRAYRDATVGGDTLAVDARLIQIEITFTGK